MHAVSVMIVSPVFGHPRVTVSNISKVEHDQDSYDMLRPLEEHLGEVMGGLRYATVLIAQFCVLETKLGDFWQFPSLSADLLPAWLLSAITL